MVNRHDGEKDENDASSQWYRRYGSAVPEGIDLTRPSVARVYDALLGGKDNFAVDRAVMAQMAEAVPDVMVGARLIRACLKRAVRTMVTEAGIDQFIDLGSGLPAQENVHEVAQRHRPTARVAYIDNDPIVLAHGRAILARDEQTTVVTADLRDVKAILDHPDVTRLIDFDRPVGLIMCGVLHYVRDEEGPDELVAAYRDGLPAGSHLFVTHVCTVENAASPEMERIFRESFDGQLRPPERVKDFFAGWELLEPGVVPVSLWRPDEPLPYAPSRIPLSHQALIGGLGRK